MMPFSDDEKCLFDLYWKMYSEYATQARQHETLRDHAKHETQPTRPCEQQARLHFKKHPDRRFELPLSGGDLTDIDDCFLFLLHCELADSPVPALQQRPNSPGGANTVATIVPVALVQ